MKMRLLVPLIAVVLGGWAAVSVPENPDAVQRFAMQYYALLCSAMLALVTAH